MLTTFDKLTSLECNDFSHTRYFAFINIAIITVGDTSFVVEWICDRTCNDSTVIKLRKSGTKQQTNHFAKNLISIYLELEDGNAYSVMNEELNSSISVDSLPNVIVDKINAPQIRTNLAKATVEDFSATPLMVIKKNGQFVELAYFAKDSIYQWVTCLIVKCSELQLSLFDFVLVDTDACIINTIEVVDYSLCVKPRINTPDYTTSD